MVFFARGHSRTLTQGTLERLPDSTPSAPGSNRIARRVTRSLGRVRAAALFVLPLAAFLVGPVIGGIGEGDGDVVTLSVLPTVLPVAALVFVAVDVSRRTGSALKAAALTGGSLALVLVGAGVYLLIAWRASSGS